MSIHNRELLAIKNLKVLSLQNFFFNLTFLRKIEQDIRSSINISLTITNLKIVSREFLRLLNLFKTQALDIHKLVKIIIVGQDKNLIFAIFQIVIPSLEYFVYGQAFLIMSFILGLY